MKAATPLFDNKRPTYPLQRLLHKTGVVHTGDIAMTCIATQIHWRKQGVHSGDIPDAYADRRGEFLPLFDEIGVIGEHLPHCRAADYWIIGGAYRLADLKRLALATRIWNEAFRYQKNFILLGGKRKASPEKETLELLNTPIPEIAFLPDSPPLTEVPATEDLIMEALLHRCDVPKVWKGQTLQVVNTPLRTDRPEKPDPSLEDTLRHWLVQYNPEPGSCVLFYSQPSVLGAQLAAQRVLGPKFPIEVVGYGVPTDKLNVSQTLDALAKLIYEMTQ